MHTLLNHQLTTRRDERGASAVEYGLLVAGIAALVVVIVFSLGTTVKKTLFENTCQEIVDGNSTISGSCA